ncbi:bis(5'-nucleosyl)-tetraphosphatase (symmetrical) YqeK [Mycoplasmatota bacterium]|nr:bis(5'-nucleosyl)-tetraphosphatase (symmetrical) YqeK [Mycoplasmatota bacterium]
MKQLTIEKALEIVKNKNELRFQHVLGTYEKAKELAKLYHINEYKTLISAILHDYAKNESLDSMKKIISDYLDPNMLNYNPVVYHGVVGAYLIQKELKIDDMDIINAVKYHVTGHPEMNDIAKIVYIADYTEKNRKQPSVEYCRSLSKISLDLGVLAVCDKTIEYLKKSNQPDIHPLAEATYQSFLKKVGVSVYDTFRNNYKGM